MSSRGRATKSKQAPVTHSVNEDAYIGNPRVAIIPSSSTSSSSSPPPSKKRKVGKAKKTKRVEMVYPYQNLTAKVRMIRIRPNEDSLTVMMASGDETYMTRRLAKMTTADWKGPYSMWKDAKELVLFGDCDTQRKVVMIMPGEEESHRLYAKKPVHTPNLLASAIVDEFFGASYLGPDASNSIHGTVYIYEEFYNPDDGDYSTDEELREICEAKEEPVTDLSDESIARLKKVWGMDEDDEDDDE